MATKWADYGISAVRFNAARTHIEAVMVHLDNGDTIGEGVIAVRSNVIASIKAGKTYATILRNSQGKWKMGQLIYIIHVNGVEYLKTVADKTTRDNLDELHEF